MIFRKREHRHDERRRGGVIFFFYLPAKGDAIVDRTRPDVRFRKESGGDGDIAECPPLSRSGSRAPICRDALDRPLAGPAPVDRSATPELPFWPLSSRLKGR